MILGMDVSPRLNERPGAASTAPAVFATWIGGHDVAKVTCSIDGCEKPSRKRGWCVMHYSRWHDYGRLDLLPKIASCSADGCDRPTGGRRFCGMHYSRYYAHGDPTIVGPRGWPTRPGIDRVLERTERTESCWYYRGRLSHKGYGVARIGSRTDGSRSSTSAHRIVYEALVGPIPVGLEIDHLCFQRNCVNPAHLEPVTHAENVRRSARRAARLRAEKAGTRVIAA